MNSKINPEPQKLSKTQKNVKKLLTNEKIKMLLIKFKLLIQPKKYYTFKINTYLH